MSPALPRHEAARSALEAAINGDRPVGLAWVLVSAFLRLTTTRQLDRPLSIEDDWERVDAWLDHADVRVVQETQGHPRLWSELLRDAGGGGNPNTDAWIAALALARGVTVLPLDSHFARLPDLAGRARAERTPVRLLRR